MRLPRGPFRAALLALALAVSLAPSGAAGGADPTIGVTGHWVIEVYQPDGTPVTRREFHNALVANGTIPLIIAGQLVVGPMEIEVDCLGQCVRPCGVACRIVDPRLTGSSAPPAGSPRSIFETLAVSSAGSAGFRLVGSAVVASDTTIAFFSTHIHTCTATAPASCGTSAAIQGPKVRLTSTALAPGMAVVRGQQVIVTITITFATAPAPVAAASQGVAPLR